MEMEMKMLDEMKWKGLRWKEMTAFLRAVNE